MKGHKGHHHGHHHGKHHARGGATGAGGSREHEVVSGNPDVLKEAHEQHGSRKHGGHVGKHRHHRRKGGHVPHHEAGHVEGHHKKHHMGRPGRKRGGGVGANDSPLSTAHKGEHSGGHTPKSGDSYGGTRPD
jgi:hypothetical protein